MMPTQNDGRPMPTSGIARTVGDAARLARREDRQRHRDDHREQHPDDDQPHGRGQVVEHQARDRHPAVLVGLTEVALERVAQERQVLLVHRLVQAHLLVQLRHGCRGRMDPEQRDGRVARDQLEQEEDHEGDPEQHRYQREQAP
jgi:hypothetical protein